jgi:DNA polymerase-3 subunit beta
MHVKVSQENLADAIQTAMPAVASRSTLPILGNLFVEAESAALRIAATNLEIGIVTHANAQTIETGAITLPAREFANYVNAMPPDVIELKLNPKTQTLSIKCANNDAQIKGVDASEFPVIPTAGNTADRAGIEPDILKSLIARSVFSAAQDDSRPVLTNVLAEFVKSNVRFVTADGFRLSVACAQLARAFDKNQNKLLPAAALKMLSKLLADQDEPVFFAFSANDSQVMFELAQTSLTCNLMDGNFPDFNQIVPKSHSLRVAVNTSELQNAIKAQSIFAKESSQTLRLDIYTETKTHGAYVLVSAQSAELGQGETKLDCTIQDWNAAPDDAEPCMSVAFNAKFLSEAVSACDSPQVALELVAPEAPGVVKPIGRDDFTHVIMPMHISNMQKPIR